MEFAQFTEPLVHTYYTQLLETNDFLTEGEEVLDSEMMIEFPSHEVYHIVREEMINRGEDPNSTEDDIKTSVREYVIRRGYRRFHMKNN